MVPLCIGCKIGNEESVHAGGNYILDGCKSLCLEDDTCVGIDFGNVKIKENVPFGDCYLNKKRFDSSSYDAWEKKKESKCGYDA